MSARERVLQDSYEEASARALTLNGLEREAARLRGERTRADAAVDRLQRASAPLAALAEARSRREGAEAVLAVGGPALDALATAVSELRAAEVMLVDADDGLSALRAPVRDAITRLVGAVQAGLDGYRSEIEATRSAPEFDALVQAEGVAASAAEAVVDALREQGIDVALYQSYRDEARSARTEEEALGAKIEAASAAEASRVELLGELRSVWTQQSTLRASAIARLNDAVPKTQDGTPFVLLELEKFGDDGSFARGLLDYRGDRRRISDEDWATLLEAVARASEGRNPTETLLEWIGILESGAVPEGLSWESGRLTQRVCEAFAPPDRNRLAATRVPDRVRVTLRRDDGTVAGELEAGLSVGQQCTAVLALLLALDTTPVVIDQPEDEIDNEFTYREMVPLLRRVKETRQVVIVTHDPNIPVNGDAEMIHALEAIGGRGVVKTVEGGPATGAIDDRRVRLAVEEIMEGSEEAFRRRFAKYGF